MLVSVGIPTHNRSSYLKLAVESVLNQSYADLELIVSDDQSTDDTESVVASFGDNRVQYKRTSARLGVPRNWNECVRLSRGELFALLPDDDEYEPGFLKSMVALLSTNAEIAFAQCAMARINSSSALIGHIQPAKEAFKAKGIEALQWQLNTLKCNPVALLFRKNPMLEMGLWREDYWDDWAFILKLAFRHGFYYTPEALARNRDHDNNLSRTLARGGRDGPLDLINQISDIFGSALPATNQMLSLRSQHEGAISRMCVRAAVKAAARRDWGRFKTQISHAWHLSPLAFIDPRGLIEGARAVSGRRRSVNPGATTVDAK